MEEFLSQLISTNNTAGLIGAVVVFIVITLQRNSTAKKRDDNSDKFDTRISLLEREIENIKAMDLAGKLASIQTDLAWIKQKLNK